MRIMKQRRPQCLLYAFAMLLDTDPEILISEIGHDGLDEYWANGELRGFHPQELIDCCIGRGKHIMTIEAYPCIINRHGSIPKGFWGMQKCRDRLAAYMSHYSGVLTNSNHAVAWCHTDSLIYDPNGTIYTSDRFDSQYFFALAESNQP